MSVEDSLSQTKRGPLSYKWLAMITASSANLFATVTMSIVNISLPSIAQSFGTDMATVQWVLVVYPLVTVSIMLAVGYFGDVWGRKRIFTYGSVVFGVSSLFCGLSQSPLQLVASRVLQGVGGAMVMANSAAIVTDAFPARERGKSLGMLSTVASIGLSAGPTIGGILVDTAGWRWVFFIAVPLSVLSVAVSTLYLRDRPRAANVAQRFDVAGTVVLFVTMSSLLLALNEAQQGKGWSAVLGGLTVVFVVGVVALITIERRAALPTVDLALLRDRLFAAAALTGLLAYVAMFGTMFLMPFYLTRTAGYTPSQAGTLLTAIPLAMGVMLTISGTLSDRFGSRWLCGAGMAVCTISLLLLAQLGRSGAYAEVGERLMLLGLGLGLFMAPNNNAVMSCVPVSRTGMASALVATLRHLGSALGVAIAGVVFGLRLTAYNAPSTPTNAGTFLFDPVASVGAFRDAYLVLALLTTVAIMAALVRGSESEHKVRVM